jgi:hypothetical protein
VVLVYKGLSVAVQRQAADMLTDEDVRNGALAGFLREVGLDLVPVVAFVEPANQVRSTTTPRNIIVHNALDDGGLHVGVVGRQELLRAPAIRAGGLGEYGDLADAT